jgi:hypothetical protein
VFAFLIHLTVTIRVMLRAQPDHVQGLVIVVVMPLRADVAADGARLARHLPRSELLVKRVPGFHTPWVDAATSASRLQFLLPMLAVVLPGVLQ